MERCTGPTLDAIDGFKCGRKIKLTKIGHAHYHGRFLKWQQFYRKKKVTTKFQGRDSEKGKENEKLVIQ